MSTDTPDCPCANCTNWRNVLSAKTAECERLERESAAKDETIDELLGALINVRARFQDYRLTPDCSRVLDRVDTVIKKEQGRAALGAP